MDIGIYARPEYYFQYDSSEFQAVIKALNVESNPQKRSDLLRKAQRIISEDYVVRRVLKSFSFKSVEKYIQEICWRTYWKGFLEHRPQIWEDYLNDLEKFLYFSRSRLIPSSFIEE